MWFIWPVPIFLLVAAALMVVGLAGRRLFRGTFGFRRAFWCPFLKTNVDVDFRKAVWDGALVDVVGCTAFSPPGDVRCEKSCLMLGSFPAVKREVTTAGR